MEKPEYIREGIEDKDYDSGKVNITINFQYLFANNSNPNNDNLVSTISMNGNLNIDTFSTDATVSNTLKTWQINVYGTNINISNFLTITSLPDNLDSFNMLDLIKTPTSIESITLNCYESNIIIDKAISIKGNQTIYLNNTDLKVDELITYFNSDECFGYIDSCQQAVSKCTMYIMYCKPPTSSTCSNYCNKNIQLCSQCSSLMIECYKFTNQCGTSIVIKGNNTMFVNQIKSIMDLNPSLLNQLNSAFSLLGMKVENTNNIYISNININGIKITTNLIEPTIELSGINQDNSKLNIYSFIGNNSN